MTGQADIVIIGGGIWGLSTAFHLARSGSRKSIVVVERNHELANETTRQAAGQIGQLRSDPLMLRAVGYTLELLTGFYEATGHDPGFCRSGSLHLAQTPQRMTAFESQRAVTRELGVEVALAENSDVARLAPGINVSKIVGAIYLPNDGFVDARKCALAFAAAAWDAGATMMLDTCVTGFEFDDRRLSRVETNQGSIETPCAVVTSGPWCGIVAGWAGTTLPMQPIRLQQVRTAADPSMPTNHPVIRIPDQSCYLRPELGGYLYGYFDPEPLAIDLDEKLSDFTTSDIQPPKDVMDEAKRRLAPILPVLEKLPVEEYRQGMVTCTPDAGYVLGRAPGREGLWVATGCGAMGIAGSGAVGRWLAKWILDDDPGNNLSRFDPGRFGPRTEDRSWVQQESRRVCASYYALNSTTYSIG